MEYLPYERIAQLVTISALNRESSVMRSFMGQLKLSQRAITIKFSDYVKSQIHLNISYNLYGRHISQYVKASYFIDGDKRYYDEVVAVLRYFYHDMANFLINNPDCIDMTVIVDTDVGEDFPVDLGDIQGKFLDVISHATSEDLPSVIDAFEYGSVFDYVEDIDDARNKARSYSLAAVLKRCEAAEGVYKVRLLNEN